MPLKIIAVIEYPDRLTLEYSVVDGYPQTFPAMGAVSLPDDLRDDRCTWDNLLLTLPPGATRDECIMAARVLLEREIAKNSPEAQRKADLLAMVNVGLEEPV